MPHGLISMKTKPPVLAPLLPWALALHASWALAQAGAEPAAETAAARTTATEAPALSANLALVSDYRFRGLSQSWGRPAVQAGFDYQHASGLYLGNWNSSVSANSYNNGAGLEMDFYGGYRFEPLAGWAADLGLLHYLYPGARLNSAPARPGSQRYDNTELYLGLSQGPFSAKLSYAVSDYFGLSADSAAYAYWSALPARGSSRGSTYLDLNYNLELSGQTSVLLHLGHTAVRRYGELSYTDYRIALNRSWQGLSLGAALVGSDADAAYYQAGNAAGAEPRRLGRPTVLLSVSKSF